MTGRTRPGTAHVCGMDLDDARRLAEKMMAEHGLAADGWVFRFDGAVKRLGQCDHTHRRITVSRHMAGACDDERPLVQTMLHEIAHALAGAGVGHGPAWKAQARAIGYTGGRTSPNPYQEKLRAAADAAAPSAGPLGRSGLPAGEEAELFRLFDLRAARAARRVARLRNSAARPVLRPGQCGVLTSGAARGARLTVHRVGRTRYRGEVEGRGEMYVPFGMVAPAR